MLSSYLEWFGMNGDHKAAALIPKLRESCAQMLHAGNKHDLSCEALAQQ
jgi:hypothetical protein